MQKKEREKNCAQNYIISTPSRQQFSNFVHIFILILVLIEWMRWKIINHLYNGICIMYGGRWFDCSFIVSVCVCVGVLAEVTAKNKREWKQTLWCSLFSMKRHLLSSGVRFFRCQYIISNFPHIFFHVLYISLSFFLFRSIDFANIR